MVEIAGRKGKLEVIGEGEMRGAGRRGGCRGKSKRGASYASDDRSAMWGSKRMR